LSTPQITNGQSTEPTACAHCGEPLRTDGRFCPGCGRPIAAAQLPDLTASAADPPTVAIPTPAAVDAPAPASDEFADERLADAPTAVQPPLAAPPPAAPPPATPPAAARPPRRGLIIGLIAGVVAIAAALAAFLLLGSSGKTDANTAYKQKVASAFGPVLGANRQVSGTLARLRGTNPSSSVAADARVAVRRAQQAATLSTGAIGALNVPAASEQLARDARQALDRESAYYAEVARVLNRPASTSTSNLSELASNLTGALSVAGPTVSGTQPTVSGTDRLVGWARNIRVRSDRAKRNRGTSSGGSRQGTQTQTTPPVTAARGTDCGGGLFAGPNTSCAFAINVRRAWLDAPGATNSVRVFSPVTNQTYTMNCGPSGSGITCSGGNNASVTFDG
jgi:hypothetical protein